MKEAEAWHPLQLLSTIFFRSLPEPALTDPDRLAANELRCLPESESSTQVFAVTLGFWHRCWGSELRFSCLQVLYPLRHSPWSPEPLLLARPRAWCWRHRHESGPPTTLGNFSLGRRPCSLGTCGAACRGGKLRGLQPRLETQRDDAWTEFLKLRVFWQRMRGGGAHEGGGDSLGRARRETVTAER